MDDSGLVFELPPFPASSKDYARWTAWGTETLEAREYGFLAPGGQHAADPRFPLALRAFIAAAVSRPAEPEKAYESAQAIFDRAHKLPAPVIRAAERLLGFCMEQGATTPDVMFLAGAFAWPLRHVAPATADDAWDYLVHAPWQTSSRALRDFCATALGSGAMRPPRRLVDLASTRLEAGLIDSAQELLEGMVLLATGLPDVGAIASADDLKKLGPVADIERAVVLLASIYASRDSDQVFAREIIRKAARIETVGSRFSEVVATRVWDRPFREAYAWSADKSKIDLDDEVGRVIGAGQPHHARRLCEAIITRELDKHVVGPFAPNIKKALERFAGRDINEITSKFQIARAAEHLAVLYSRTGYCTAPARELVRRVLMEPELSGASTPLEHLRSELEAYLVETSPYGVLRRQDANLDEARRSMTDDEKAALEQSQRWMETSFTRAAGAAETAIQAVTSPILDLGGILGSAFDMVTGIQDASERALHFVAERAAWLAGDLDELSAKGAAIRDRAGAGLQLKDYASEATRFESGGAGIGAGALALLPPGFGLVTAAADIAVLLIASYRVVARVGAVYGTEMRGPAGFAFAADAFALGCSSKDGEGLLAYATRGKRTFSHSVTLGSAAYGSVALAQHLWTATNQPAAAVLQQAIKNTARLLGISLAQKEVAKLVPFAGAVISGMSAHAFVESIRSAALEIAARDALLEKVPLT